MTTIMLPLSAGSLMSVSVFRYLLLSSDVWWKGFSFGKDIGYYGYYLLVLMENHSPGY